LVAPPGPLYAGDFVYGNWSFTVTNVGTRETRKSTWFDRVFLSRDASLDASDQMLWSGERTSEPGIGPVLTNPPLAPGDSYTIRAALVLPNGIEGDFYLLVYTDATAEGNLPGQGPPGVGDHGGMGGVEEFRNEDNNITAAAIHIFPRNLPD